MKVKEIKVGFRYKKNLGNYQSADYEAELVATIGENETEEEVYQKAWKAVKAQVANEVSKPIG